MRLAGVIAGLGSFLVATTMRENSPRSLTDVSEGPCCSMEELAANGVGLSAQENGATDTQHEES